MYYLEWTRHNLKRTQCNFIREPGNSRRSPGSPRIPVCGVMGGVIFWGEEIDIEQLVEGLVIVAGVTLVTLSGRSFKGSNSQEGHYLMEKHH